MIRTKDDASVQGAARAAYDSAQASYAAYGVDTNTALSTLEQISVSVHCWQGDDIVGFEKSEDRLFGGGIQATGNYPGKARNAQELRSDLDMTLGLIPGSHRVSLHASYAEAGRKKVERDQLVPEHFSEWIQWAGEKGIGLDFNGTFFSHPHAESGFTLASRDRSVRDFWIRHAICCRQIGEAMGTQLGSPCIVNLWIPDGYKDTPVDRYEPRAILKGSLDKIFEKDLAPESEKDALECKLFGIGSESYVVGSHEFYLGYAMQNGKMLCIDMGHFHPTELIADKISSILTFSDELLLHVSRGIRWDSDHVVILDDAVRAAAHEIGRGDAWSRVHLALDFFDASINRIAAWVVGTRALLKSVLISLLEPVSMLQEAERNGDFTTRLALLEELKGLPWGAVWDKFCMDKDVPIGAGWLEEVKQYEKSVLSAR